MPSEHKTYYDLGMDALVTLCSENLNVIMAWPWMLWRSYALRTRTLLRFGAGCSNDRMLLEHEIMKWFGHGCSGCSRVSWFGHGC